MNPNPQSLTDALTKRFRHFDAERCAPLFSPDQEGAYEVAGRLFPAALMANATKWFYDRAQRPSRKDGSVMKSKHARGDRILLCSHPDAQELIFVEGEGHAVALVSIGATGVVACGGISAVTSRAAPAKEQLQRLCAGKRIRVLFDPDQAGQAAAPRITRALLAVGATRVAVLPPQEDWQAGWDVEDWLATFPSPAAAYAALMPRLTALPWVDEAAQARPEEALPEQRIDVARLKVGDHRVLAMAAEQDGEIGLLVWAPSGLLRDGILSESQGQQGSVMHDDEPLGPYVAEFVPSFEHDGQRYIPTEITEEMIREESIVPLPVPGAELLEADLDVLARRAFDAVERFIRRWVVLADDHLYPVLAAWVLVSYIREDLPVMELAFIRLSGESGSGKTKAWHVLRLLCCLAKLIGPSEHNLHLIAAGSAERTVFADEQQWLGKRMNDFLNALVKGTSRYNKETRKKANSPDLVDHRCFMQSCTAGYAQVFPHPAAERRIINIPMREGMLDESNPEHQRLLYAADVPKEMQDEARAVRQVLVAYRLENFQTPIPELSMAEEKELLGAGGTDLRGAFRALYAVTPPERRKADLLPYLKSRREAVHEAREFDEKGSVLSAVGAAIESFQQEDPRTDELRLAADHENGLVYLLRPLTEQIERDLDLGQGEVKRMLAKALGVPLKELAVRRRAGGARHPRVMLAIDLRRDRSAFAKANVNLLSVEELNAKDEGAM